MAAAPKVTPEQRAEIVRRHAEGETFTAIGLELGFPHSTIARNYEKELARQAAVRAKTDADAAEDREWDEYLDSVAATWKVDFDPDANGPLYPSWGYCLAYWEQKKNAAPSGRPLRLAIHDYNTVAHLARLLPVEVRAMSKGRLPYLCRFDWKKSLDKP